MDLESQISLARLIRGQRIASLGTLRQGAPFVSMVLYAVSPDFSEFYIHVSRLAHHTQDLLQDARVSLMITETDREDVDPQVLARVSLLGTVELIPAEVHEYQASMDREGQFRLSCTMHGTVYIPIKVFSNQAIRSVHQRPDSFRRASSR